MATQTNSQKTKWINPLFYVNKCQQHLYKIEILTYYGLFKKPFYFRRYN